VVLLFADPSGRAVQDVGLRPLACWNFGFESRRGNGCTSVVSVLCCRVEVCASDWSLVRRRPTDCSVSSECHRKAPKYEAKTTNGVGTPHTEKKIFFLSTKSESNLIILFRRYSVHKEIMWVTQYTILVIISLCSGFEGPYLRQCLYEIFKAVKICIDLILLWICRQQVPPNVGSI